MYNEQKFRDLFLLMHQKQLNPPVKRSIGIINELTVTTNQIAVFCNSNCN